MFWILRHEAGLKLLLFYSLERGSKLKVKASVSVECVNLTRVMCYHQHLTAGLMRAGRHVMRWGGVGSAQNQHERVCVSVFLCKCTYDCTCTYERVCSGQGSHVVPPRYQSITIIYRPELIVGPAVLSHTS